MNKVDRQIYVVLLAMGLLLPTKLLASGYKQLVSQFKAGKYEATRAKIRKTMPGKTGYQRGQLFKLYGMCQFMEGKPQLAKRYFAKALKADRSLNISPKETRKPALVRLFKKSKGTYKNNARKQEQPFAQTYNDDPFGAELNKPVQSQNKSQKSQLERRPPSQYGLSSKPAQESDADDTNYFLLAMPLGIGQFVNGSYILGGVIGAVELGAAYYWFSGVQAEEQALDEATNEVVQLERKDSFDAEEVNAISSNYSEKSAAAQQQQTMGLAILGLAVIGGAIEAISNAPETGIKSKKKANRQRRKRKLYSQDNFNFGVAPVRSPSGSQPTVAMKASIGF